MASGEEYVPYKEKFSFAMRRERCNYISRVFPGRFVIVIERSKSEKNLPHCKKNLFVMYEDCQMFKVINYLRQNIKVGPYSSIFVMTAKGQLVNCGNYLWEVYEEHKDEDGHLYLTYCSQEVFG